MRINGWICALVVFIASQVHAQILIECNGCSEEQKQLQATNVARIFGDYDIYMADFRFNHIQRYSVAHVEIVTGGKVSAESSQRLQREDNKTQTESSDNKQPNEWVASPVPMDSSIEKLLDDLRNDWWVKQNVTTEVNFDRHFDGGSNPALNMLDNAFDLTGCSSCIKHLALWSVQQDANTARVMDLFEKAASVFKFSQINFNWQIKTNFSNGSWAIIKLNEGQTPTVQVISDRDGNLMPLDGNVSNQTFVFSSKLTLNDFANWAKVHGIRILNKGGSTMRCDRTSLCVASSS